MVSPGLLIRLCGVRRAAARLPKNKKGRFRGPLAPARGAGRSSAGLMLRQQKTDPGQAQGRRAEIHSPISTFARVRAIESRGTQQCDSNGAISPRHLSVKLSSRARAQMMLGFMYERGEGISRDYGRAAEWYRKGAEHGYAWAQASLGKMYAYGQGVPQDYRRRRTGFAGLEALSGSPNTCPGSVIGSIVCMLVCASYYQVPGNVTLSWSICPKGDRNVEGSSGRSGRNRDRRLVGSLCPADGAGGRGQPTSGCRTGRSYRIDRWGARLPHLRPQGGSPAHA